MKITKSQLKRIIKEEIKSVLEEAGDGRWERVLGLFNEYAKAHGGTMPDAKILSRAFAAALKSSGGEKMTTEEGKLANAFFDQYKKVTAWKDSAEKQGKKQGTAPTPAQKPAPTPAQPKPAAPAPEKPGRGKFAQGTLRGVTVVGVKKEGKFVVATVKHKKSGMTATGKAKLSNNPRMARKAAIARAKANLLPKVIKQSK